MRGQDLLTALADELKGLALELVSAYDAGSPGDDAYLTSVSRLSEAAGYMGLASVQRIGSCVLDNLNHLDSDDQDARVLVRPGDKVPLDGVVAEGESAIDEAQIGRASCRERVSSPV